MNRETPTRLERLRMLPAPEPAQGQQAYADQRERALAFSEKRRANFEKYRASRRGERVDYLPVKLDIENVSRCNFRCTMCAVSDWPKGKRSDDLSLDAFKRLIDEQYGLVEIKLQGIGEPTMQGDDFFEMIRYARAQEIWVRTTTNASLLHLRDNYKKLIDSDPNEVQISVDGADKETFEKIRRGSKFERVVDSCKRINAYAKSVGARCTKMWTVVQEANKHQLPGLVDLAAELGFASMVFSLNLTDWGQSEWRRKNDDVSVEDEFDPEFAAQLSAKGGELGIKVGFWTITQKYRTDAPEHLCPWPFERAYFSSDARITPCCMIGIPEVYEFEGAEQGFSKVWLGDEYHAFREAHSSGRIPDVCRGCYADETAK